MEEPCQHRASRQEATVDVRTRVGSRSTRQNKCAYDMGAEDAAADSDSEDSNFDPGAIVDSDFDISDGDDDLYTDNVDEDEPVDKKDKGKQRGEDKGK